MTSKKNENSLRSFFKQSTSSLQHLDNNDYDNHGIFAGTPICVKDTSCLVSGHTIHPVIPAHKLSGFYQAPFNREESEASCEVSNYDLELQQVLELSSRENKTDPDLQKVLELSKILK
mmetsp:Transcript_27020/g.53992  ORF Transcript_27020/g.53992 Transcript_27020/m.53992 type:complete len:118 (+) Transcript_27020:3170-3523(+)